MPCAFSKNACACSGSPMFSGAFSASPSLEYLAQMSLALAASSDFDSASPEPQPAAATVARPAASAHRVKCMGAILASGPLGRKACPPPQLPHSCAMALTHVGREVRLRLPRWDDHLVDRLVQAGIDAPEAPDRIVIHPLETTLRVPAETEADARRLVMDALRGWTGLLGTDFA